MTSENQPLTCRDYRQPCFHSSIWKRHPSTHTHTHTYQNTSLQGVTIVKLEYRPCCITTTATWEKRMKSDSHACTLGKPAKVPACFVFPRLLCFDTEQAVQPKSSARKPRDTDDSVLRRCVIQMTMNDSPYLVSWRGAICTKMS